MNTIWFGPPRLAAVLLLLVAAGCAPRGTTLRPQDLPRLESAAAAAPDDLELQTRLGIAYFSARRFDEARATLQRTVERGGGGGAALLYLGMANEELESWTAARGAYTRYLELGRSDPLKESVRARLALVVRKQLQQDARLALQREQELSEQPPAPRSVAVFPLRLFSERQELKPLELALAEMIVTDLQLSGALLLIERIRVQTILDELALAEAGYTAPEVGVRTGRLLRAEHVLQGALTMLDSEALRVDMSLVHSGSRRTTGDVTQAGQLEQLFDLQKEIVFDILDRLGVQLTPVEREAIGANRTANLLALLAYGRGLEAADRGDFAQAAREFRRAVELDPGFRSAEVQLSEALDLQAAVETPLEQMAQVGMSEVPGGLAAGAELDMPLGSTLEQVANEVVPSPATQLISSGNTQDGGVQQATNREPAQEGQQQEGVTRTRTTGIIISIPNPNPRTP